MQKIDGLIYYAASDIVNFLECEHLTALDLINLETPLPQAEDDEEAVLYQQKGIPHEGSYVDHLRNSVSCLPGTGMIWMRRWRRLRRPCGPVRISSIRPLCGKALLSDMRIF